MAKPKILVDLALGHRRMGFSGIPQDTRLLFAGLAHSETLDVTGLLWSRTMSWHGRKLDNVESQAIFLGPYLDDPRPSLSARLLGMINARAGTWYERLVASRMGRFQLNELADFALKDVIWRQVFAMTVDPRERLRVLGAEFALTELGLWPVGDSVLYGHTPPKLATPGFDYALFQDARNVIVAPGTRKLIRYHDGLPVLASDTQMSSHSVERHVRSVQACAQDSIFVCNSDSARQDLEHFSARAADNAVVIPYFVPRLEPGTLSAQGLCDAAMMRVSSSTIDGKGGARRLVEAWFQSSGRAETSSAAQDHPVLPLAATKPVTPKFILSLATIEPRKNYPGLIRAWQFMRHNHDPNIKLAIIGRPGWEFEAILKEMRPHVAAGTMLHLEAVPQDELKYWYSAASCFAFPSFAEGFGLPPVEAMQCGCPVLVSDVPAHRYSCGDAAMFCDPYDHEDIARGLLRLTDPKHREEVEALRVRGFRNAARFTREAVLPLWEDLFTDQKLRTRS